MRWLSVSYFINEKELFHVHFWLIILPIQYTENQCINCSFAHSKSTTKYTLFGNSHQANFCSCKGTFKRPIYVAFTI